MNTRESRKKAKLEMKKRDKMIKRINELIKGYNDALDVLHLLSIATKKSFLLSIADIAKASCLYSHQLTLLSVQIAANMLISTIKKKQLIDEFHSHDNKNIFQCISKKIKIVMKLIKYSYDIAAAKQLLNKYQHDLNSLSNALEVCSEYGRRLSFYFSFEK